MARAAGLPTLFIEIMFTYVLIFGAPDMATKKIAQQMLGSKIGLITTYQERYAPKHRNFEIYDFPIYASRIRVIMRTMDDWRPRSILERIVFRPYSDPLSFYAFWFAVVIGIVTVLGLGSTMAQTYATFKALP